MYDLNGGITLKSKFYIIVILAFFLILGIYFRHIIFALILSSEHIDKHTISAMFQGRIQPVKKIDMQINDEQYTVSLPKSAGKVADNEYIIPQSSWAEYKKSIPNKEWVSLDQNGTVVAIKNKTGREIYISIRPYTGSYFILKYNQLK